MFLNESTNSRSINVIKFANNVFVSDDEMLRQCGACAVHMGDLGAVAADVIRPADAARFSSLDDDQGVIFIAPYMMKALSQEELGAIIAHEEGHIALGHVEKHKGRTGVIADLSMELEADEYAASRCGARTMRAALGSTVTAIIAEMSALYSVPPEAQRKIYMGAVRKLKPRLSALRAAM